MALHKPTHVYANLSCRNMYDYVTKTYPQKNPTRVRVVIVEAVIDL